MENEMMKRKNQNRSLHDVQFLHGVETLHATSLRRRYDIKQKY